MNLTTALLHLTVIQQDIRTEVAKAKEHMLEQTYELDRSSAIATRTCYQQEDKDKPRNSIIADAWINTQTEVIATRSQALTAKQYHERIHAFMESIDTAISIYKSILQNGLIDTLDVANNKQIDTFLAGIDRDFNRFVADNCPY